MKATEYFTRVGQSLRDSHRKRPVKKSLAHLPAFAVDAIQNGWKKARVA